MWIAVAIIAGTLCALLFRSPLFFILTVVVVAIFFWRDHFEAVSISNEGLSLSEVRTGDLRRRRAPGEPPIIKFLREADVLRAFEDIKRTRYKAPGQVALGPCASATILAYFLSLIGEHRPEISPIELAAIRVGRCEPLTQQDGFLLMTLDPKPRMSNLLVLGGTTRNVSMGLRPPKVEKYYAAFGRLM